MNEMRRLQSAQAQAAAAAARAAVAPTRMAIVDSYDPTNHLVRVRLQPEDILTGWMPWRAVAAGNGWGLMAAPVQGAQCLVDFEGGDVQVGVAHGGVFSDVDRPPTLQAGEMAAVHSSGSQLIFKADGTVQLISHTDMAITCGGTITSSAQAWNHTGPIHATGQITSDADVVASGVSLKTHHHTLVKAGTDVSGPPG